MTIEPKGVVAFYRYGSENEPHIIDIPIFVDGRKLAADIQEVCPDLIHYEMITEVAQDIEKLCTKWAKLKPSQRKIKALRELELWAAAFCVLIGYKNEFVAKVPEGRAALDAYFGREPR